LRRRGALPLNLSREETIIDVADKTLQPARAAVAQA
jgi:hypothetical protein